MKPEDFHAQIERRSVVVACPDNDKGGAMTPPIDSDEEWIAAAQNQYADLFGVEGPTIQGAYVFHWSGQTVTDDEILRTSVRILWELY